VVNNNVVAPEMVKMEDSPTTPFVPELESELSFTPPISPSMFFSLSPSSSPLPALFSSDDGSLSPDSFCGVMIKEEPYDELEPIIMKHKISLSFDVALSVEKKEVPKRKRNVKPAEAKNKVKEEPKENSARGSEDKAKKIKKEKKEEEDLDLNAKRAKRFCMNPQVCIVPLC
jgi:hypothetical protein